MAAFGLVEREYASIRGVAMEPSAFGSTRTFTLFRDAQLTRRARWASRRWVWPGVGHSTVTLAGRSGLRSWAGQRAVPRPRSPSG